MIDARANRAEDLLRAVEILEAEQSFFLVPGKGTRKHLSVQNELGERLYEVTGVTLEECLRTAATVAQLQAGETEENARLVADTEELLSAARDTHPPICSDGLMSAVPPPAAPRAVTGAQLLGDHNAQTLQHTMVGRADSARCRRPMTAAQQVAGPCEVLCCVDDDRGAWLRHRHIGIGASEIASVLSESPFASALELYAQKIDRYERDLSDVESVYWGQKLESSIIEAYWERTGRQTRKAGRLLRSTAHPWALCTLDGETWDAPTNEPWPLEIKNISSFKAGEWVDGPPIHYYLQVQQQMLVTGARKATIAALLGGQRMVWADVERDETTIRRIVHHGARFWQRVLDRDMPAPDGTEGSRRALAALYPVGSGIMVLPAAATDAADEIENLKAERKRISDRLDLIENHVRAALADAEIGVLPDGRSFSHKLQSRKESITPASKFRVLRLHQSKR